MDANEEQNPYESPSEAITLAVSLESVMRRAKLAWQSPLIGMLIYAVLFTIEILELVPTSLSFLLLIAIPFCLVAGTIFTIYGIVQSRAFPATMPHAIAGLAAMLALLFMLCAGTATLFSIQLPPQG